jgi:hypothetical protein
VCVTGLTVIVGNHVPLPIWATRIYVHVCKMETLRAAYEMAKRNDGAPGIDGVTFEAIETQGVEARRRSSCRFMPTPGLFRGTGKQASSQRPPQPRESALPRSIAMAWGPGRMRTSHWRHRHTLRHRNFGTATHCDLAAPTVVLVNEQEV